MPDSLGAESTKSSAVKRLKLGALAIRIGFWGPPYYNYNKEPPKIL